jgi:ABC-type multidrug transport system fused ATPase/permease subunit
MSPIDFYSIIYALPRGQSGFPTKKAMSEATGLNIWNVKLFLKGLVKSGKIRMEGNWYKFNNKKQINIDNSHESLKEAFEKEITNKQVKDYMDYITEEDKHDSVEANLYLPKIKMPKRFQNKLESFSILRWVMLLVGISSSVMSAYYTQIWQHETLSIFWSWFLSLIMIIFSSAAFLTLIGLLSKSIESRFSTWLLSGIFFILWIICLIYSIQVTVAGRFAQYQEIVSKNKTETVNQVKSNNILSSIESLKLDKMNNQKQLDILLKQYDYAQVDMQIKGTSIQSIKNDIDKIKNVLMDVNGKLENKNLEYEKIIGNGTTNNEAKFGFYDWAAKIYKTDRGNVEWIMLLFPSLFLDIASPIALAVFMFLGRKKEE